MTSQQFFEVARRGPDPSQRRDSDTSEAIQSYSEAEERRVCDPGVVFKLTKNEAKFRVPPRKKKVDEPTIEEQLRPVPRQLETLEMAPSAQSTASAKEWLEDIELIQGRSSYQGMLSKRIKERVTVLKRVMEILAVRIEGKGDTE